MLKMLIIPPLRHFAILGQENTLLHCRTGQKYGRKVDQQNGRTNDPINDPNLVE